MPPFFESLGRRLVKSPKLYFVDSGLACHLLGIETERDLDRSPFLGPLFEGFVASEVVKQQANAGRRREIYHFRDEQGLEVDLVVPTGNGRLVFIEAKASRTALPRMADAVTRLERFAAGFDVTGLVVYRGRRGDSTSVSLGRGVRAVGVDHLDLARVRRQ